MEEEMEDIQQMAIAEGILPVIRIFELNLVMMSRRSQVGV